MAENFVLGGEPWSIRSSARTWSGFASSASTASGDIRGLDADDFVGDEGETFRSKMNDDLPPNLDTTSEAWGIVAAALSTYADKLEEYQSQLASLKIQYDNQQQTASDASTNLENAQQSDQTEQDRVTTAKADLEPGQTLPRSTYVSQTSGAQTAYDEANQNVQDTLDSAAQIRSDHRTAVDTCCREIDRAKDLRFEEPPGFLGELVNSVGDWITEHADILKAISSVLKTISGIAGLLSMIPILAPVMGPIALATGGAALVIDVGVKLATGEGSWTQIGLDALGMIPGARAMKMAMAADVGMTGYNVATGEASMADLAMTVGLSAMGARGNKGGKFGGPKSNNSSSHSVMRADKVKKKPLQDLEIRYSKEATAIGSDTATVNNFGKSPGGDRHDVIIHGSRDGRFGADGRDINPYQVAEIVANNPHYKHGTPIRMVSCHSLNGHAEPVANVNGANTVASEHRVSLDESGRMWVYPDGEPPRPAGPGDTAEINPGEPNPHHAPGAEPWDESGSLAWRTGGGSGA